MSGRSPAAVLAAAYAGTFAVLGLALVVARATDHEFPYLTTEPAGALNEPAYIGFLSNVTALVGIAGTAACLLAWLATAGGRSSPWLWGGLLLGALTLNDVFLVDDHYLEGIGVPEPVTSAALGAASIAFVVVFRDFVRGHGPWIAALALVGFFSAELLDRASQHLDSVEDMFRFVSQLSWALLFVRAAVVGLGTGAGGGARLVSSRLAGTARSPVVPAAIYGGALLLVAFVYLAGRAVDRPVSYFTREPADAVHAPAYVGALSNLGALIWGTAATACLLTWLVTSRSRRSPLLWGGLLTALLLADDFFQLHDDWYPKLGIPQRAANVVYFGLTIAYLVGFRRWLRAHAGWMLVLAFALLGGSAALDSAYRDQDAIEDSVKLLGIVTWATFFVLVSLDELRRAMRPSSSARTARVAAGDPGADAVGVEDEPVKSAALEVEVEEVAARACDQLHGARDARAD
jgi:hypothetical protein